MVFFGCISYFELLRLSNYGEIVDKIGQTIDLLNRTKFDYKFCESFA